MQLMSIKAGQLCVLLLTYIGEKGGLGGEAPQTLTRSYYFEPPLSKKCSRATALIKLQPALHPSILLFWFQLSYEVCAVSNAVDEVLICNNRKDLAQFRFVNFLQLTASKSFLKE